MTRTSFFILPLALAGLLLQGCVSTGMARTLDEGQLQVSLTPGAGDVTGLQSNGSLTGPGVAFPQAELGVRYGLTDKVDVGARLLTLGVGVDTRVALARAPSLEHGLDLTLAPSLLYLFNVGGGSKGAMALEVPLLFGVNLGGSQLVLGPRVGYVQQLGDVNRFVSFNRNNVLVGTSVGLAVPVAPWLRIVPEGTVRLSVPVPGSHEQDVVFQGGLGLLFGGYTRT